MWYNWFHFIQINIDFHHLFGAEENLLILKWQHFKAKVICYMKNKMPDDSTSMLLDNYASFDG
jgi:hypothetical protein